MRKINNVKKVSILGIIVNVVLLVIKLTVGIFFKSQSMIADAIHSIEDALCSFLSYIGAKASSKPKDISHPYGHGKVEYVFSFIIAITMIIASFSILKSSVSSIFSPKKVEFSIWLIIVCIVNILLKLILFLYTRNKYNQSNNILIKASMEDHRNDIFLTSGTLIGVTFGYLGIYIIDSLIGGIISLWILYIGIKLFIESYIVLIDTNISNTQIEEIKYIFSYYLQGFEMLDVIAKPVGNRYLIIVKLNVVEDISTKHINLKITNIKKVLKERYEYICDVIIDLSY